MNLAEGERDRRRLGDDDAGCIAHFGLGDDSKAESELREAWEPLAEVDTQNDRQREAAMSARAWHVRALLRLERPVEAKKAFADLEQLPQEPLTPSTRGEIAAAKRELED